MESFKREGEHSIRRETDIFNFGIDEVGKAHMLETARWARFLAIVNIIMISLMVIIVVLVAYANGSDFAQTFGPQVGMGFGIASLVFYILLVLLFMYPLVGLLRFSNKIRPALETGNAELFNESFRNLKNVFKFFGILTIALLAIYGIMIVMGILTVAMTG
ncbi:MAG: hypothetical protein EOP49_17870 [Sphingobacteriales bacterium]|nr:MAG: hypothetical protein EOP49_17870 [Sphingobacteriales bacterium]